MLRPMTTSAASKDPLTEPEPWNAIAVGYDEEFSGRLPELADEALNTLRPSADDVVLDLATGPGNLAVALAPRVARVVAVDFAESMIARLRRRVDDHRISNVEAHVMDGHALALADESFDAVVSMFGWFLFADRARALREIRRVVRRGRPVLVTSWMPPDENTVLGAGLDALRAILPDMPRPSGPMPTQIPDVCAEELRSAGFDDVTARVIAVDVVYDSVDAYWRTVARAAAPMVLLQRRLGEERFRAVSEGALARLRDQLGDGRITLKASSIFTSGTAPLA